MTVADDSLPGTDDLLPYQTDAAVADLSLAGRSKKPSLNKLEAVFTHLNKKVLIDFKVKK